VLADVDDDIPVNIVCKPMVRPAVAAGDLVRNPIKGIK
jgi:hypothetical protein